MEEIKKGQFWVWKKTSGLHEGFTLKLRIDRIDEEYVYYYPEGRIKYNEHNPFGKSFAPTPIVDENTLRLSKTSLLATGFKIDRWEDWPIPEPPLASSRLDDIE